MKYLETHADLMEAIVGILKDASFEEFVPTEPCNPEFLSTSRCFSVKLYDEPGAYAPKAPVFVLLHKEDGGILMTVEYPTDVTEGFFDNTIHISSSLSMQKFFPLEHPDVLTETECRPSEYAFVSVSSIVEWTLKSFYARCTAIDALNEGAMLAVSQPINPIKVFSNPFSKHNL